MWLGGSKRAAIKFLVRSGCSGAVGEGQTCTIKFLVNMLRGGGGWLVQNGLQITINFLVGPLPPHRGGGGGGGG